MSPDPALVPHGVTVPCLTTLDAGRIREHLRSGRFFWIELTDPSAAEVDQMSEIFGFHSLALEDTAHFGQRSKLDDYGDYGFLVFYGAVQQRHDDFDLPREVHLFVSGQYIVSVHREPLPALDGERSRLKSELVGSEQVVLHRIVDSLTDTFFPAARRHRRRDRHARGSGHHAPAAPATVRAQAAAGLYCGRW